ncbi:hypothetical protein [Gluconacetobacter tumulicola]|uniref:Uncharacterized protein n=1 Tax=Gluconacetobacter tumulicola TaxID=1017177 RepID=A0A7W4P7E4_9PROT|nr:hypothetical protein [Gluconacetobacter tumulicola]MBB2180117.1 hypothetical protein [Gluconacetobacter tumulicola]
MPPLPVSEPFRKIADERPDHHGKRHDVRTKIPCPLHARTTQLSHARDSRRDIRGQNMDRQRKIHFYFRSHYKQEIVRNIKTPPHDLFSCLPQKKKKDFASFRDIICPDIKFLNRSKVFWFFFQKRTETHPPKAPSVPSKATILARHAGGA